MANSIAEMMDAEAVTIGGVLWIIESFAMNVTPHEIPLASATLQQAVPGRRRYSMTLVSAHYDVMGDTIDSRIELTDVVEEQVIALFGLGG